MKWDKESNQESWRREEMDQVFNNSRKYHLNPHMCPIRVGLDDIFFFFLVRGNRLALRLKSLRGLSSFWSSFSLIIFCTIPCIQCQFFSDSSIFISVFQVSPQNLDLDYIKINICVINNSVISSSLSNPSSNKCVNRHFRC